MKPFNLAEARIAERNYCRLHLHKRLRVIAVFVALTLIVAAGSGICRIFIAGKTSRNRSELVKAQDRCIQVKEEIASVNLVLDQFKWENQLASESKRQLGLLKSILCCIPKDVYLDRIENSAKDTTVQISGNTTSFDALSMFVAALQATPAFSETNLGSAKVDNQNGSNCIDFMISIKLKEGGAAGTSSSNGKSAPPASSGVPRVKESA